MSVDCRWASVQTESFGLCFLLEGYKWIDSQNSYSLVGFYAKPLYFLTTIVIISLPEPSFEPVVQVRNKKFDH